MHRVGDGVYVARILSALEKVEHESYDASGVPRIYKLGKGSLRQKSGEYISIKNIYEPRVFGLLRDMTRGVKAYHRTRTEKAITRNLNKEDLLDGAMVLTMIKSSSTLQVHQSHYLTKDLMSRQH